MLNVLTYSVEFPTTGRRFENAITFAPGLTSITGRNEAGKTVVLEMIGYCLFGKQALRGAATDYRNLTATLSLTIRDQEVLISRAPRRETLTVAGEEKAVGADALNRAIPALLGFGLDVFNIACAAQQGNIGALTEMLPTARRKMVDKLMGLDQLEAIEKDCRDEARAKGELASGLAMSFTAPEQPVQPDGYEPSDKLRTLILTVETLERERLDLLRLQEPVQPAAPAHVEGDVEALELHESRRQAQLQERARFEGQLARIPKLTVTQDQIERAVKYREYVAEVVRRGPRPEVSVDLLQDMERALDAQQRAGAEVQCPSCDHHFHPGLTPQEEGLLEYVVPLTRAQITTEFRRHQLWAEPLAEVEKVEITDLDAQIVALKLCGERAMLEVSLAAPQIEDLSAELRAARAYQQALAVYESQMHRFAADYANWCDAQDALANWPDRSGELEQLRVKLAQAQSYEQLLASYERDMVHYNTVMDQSRKAREEADGYTAGARALAATRVAVKAELAPSLSLAASSLLASMTGGERRTVVVDEDFEVMVDGQPLRTLSGSGKSVVNLALRIGMGQVLTSRVLPIFLGDEIDAAMDNDRAGTTHQTMQILREHLTQIILITHKEMEADQTILLGT